MVDFYHDRYYHEMNSSYQILHQLGQKLENLFRGPLPAFLFQSRSSLNPETLKSTLSLTCSDLSAVRAYLLITSSHEKTQREKVFLKLAAAKTDKNLKLFSITRLNLC